MTATCLECGVPLPAKRRADKQFCSTPCRLEFLHRCMTRGSQLYAVFMEMRFNRKRGSDAKLWSVMCTMASQWHDGDKLRRPGRKSWRYRPAAAYDLAGLGHYKTCKRQETAAATPV